MVINPDSISFEQKDKIKKIIGSCRLDSTIIESLGSIVNADNWTEPFGLSLLSSKLIGLLTGKYFIRKCNTCMHRNCNTNSYHLISVENKLLLEDDLIVQARIDVLMQLFELSNSEDVSTMILNVFETYRKLLIREKPIQNKLSCTTITKLLKSNMIILCHRKQYDHLYSMVRLPSMSNLFYFIVVVPF